MGLPELHIADGVATLSLQRPEKANRLTADDLVALAEHIEAVNADTSVRVLRLTASGKSFCAGYDIGSIGQPRTRSFGDVANALEAARPVTMAVLQGGVYGGATDLVLACDFRIGVPGVEMFMPAARLGLHYYPEGMQRYVSRLGLNAAKRLFLTAERIDAQEMKAIGFLTHLAPADALREAVDKLTSTLTDMAPLPLLGMKRYLNQVAQGRGDELDEVRATIARVADSEDLREGQRAWLEKRKPRFTGR